MSIVKANIVQGATLTAAMDPFYTVPAITRATITNCTLSNETGGPVAGSIQVFTGSNVAKKLSPYGIVDSQTYTCPELIGAVLEPGAILKAKGLGLNFDVSANLQVQV